VSWAESQSSLVDTVQRARCHHERHDPHRTDGRSRFSQGSTWKEVGGTRVRVAVGEREGERVGKQRRR
jgi:hypothetical protein